MRRDGEMSGGCGTRRRRLQTLEAELARLEALGASGLQEAWAKAHGGPAPTALPDRLLRLALAHHLQAGTLGGLAPSLERRLVRITDGADRSDTARPVPIKIKPGATLLRDWGGRTWRVEVIADGSFEWGGRRWRSLSAIAREITGTSRNGPAFFGLRGGATHGAA
jgi:hypothetical protein